LFRGDPVPQTPDAPAAAAQDMFADTKSDAVLSSPLPKGTELDHLPKPKIVDEETGGLSFDTPWLPVGLAGIGLLALAGVGW